MIGAQISPFSTCFR